jgi:acetyl esterase/lipase
VRGVLAGGALLCCALAFAIVLWIVVPAPVYRLWQVAVGASEWSLWFGLLALVGVILAVAALTQGSRVVGGLALGLGIAALGIAAVPTVQALGVARANGVPLSIGEWFGALTAAAPTDKPHTVTFATVDGQPLLLDAFVPGDGATARPAVIVVHGGSWSGGDKTDFPQWDRWLVQQGYAVFDIQYRLTPQPNWQTATGDVKCAIGWVKRNAATYGVDPGRLALLGRSAGGHLALLSGYTPGDGALAPSCDAPDTTVQAVISLYGPADLVWGYNNPARPDVIDGPGTLRNFLGGTPETAAEAFGVGSPINHVGPSTPPTLLLHGGRDQLVGQHHAELLSGALKAADVQYRTVFIPYGQHGFDYNFYGWSSQIVRPIIGDFLRTYLVDDA